MNNAIKTTLLVSTVAAMFGCAGQTPAAQTPSGTAANTVRCFGINECKGHGTCAANGHSCGRHTPCKGQGWLPTQTTAQCEQRGGRPL